MNVNNCFDCKTALKDDHRNETYACCCQIDLFSKCEKLGVYVCDKCWTPNRKEYAWTRLLGHTIATFENPITKPILEIDGSAIDRHYGD